MAESKLTANMRPVLCFGLMSVIGATMVAGVIDGLFGTHVAPSINAAMAQIPQSVIDATVQLVSGWGVLRTAEKITTTVKG